MALCFVKKDIAFSLKPRLAKSWHNGLAVGRERVYCTQNAFLLEEIFCMRLPRINLSLG